MGAAYIISQVLVCLADLLYVISMLTKKKISLVTFLFISDVLFASHYFLLDGGLTGAATILIDVVYLVVMFLLEKFDKTKFNLLTTILAIIATIIVSIFTWESAISLLPMFSMLTYLTSMMFTNLIICKTGALIRNTLNVIYMFLIASYFGAGLEIVLMISAIVGIILNYNTNKKKEKADLTSESKQENETKNNTENSNEISNEIKNNESINNDVNENNITETTSKKMKKDKQKK